MESGGKEACVCRVFNQHSILLHVLGLCGISISVIIPVLYLQWRLIFNITL